METIRILGVDPSLRNTGLAVVSFNTERLSKNSSAFEVSHCQVLVNPPKYTGKDAILNMLDMIDECSRMSYYQEVDNVIVESPAVMFNKAWSAGTISSIAHVSGGAVALLGIEKSFLFRPNEWTKTRKKEVTHSQTIAFLGSLDQWHYEKRIKSEKMMEHILDATSLALFWIRSNYLEE
jgi:hypothetical protein